MTRRLRIRSRHWSRTANSRIAILKRGLSEGVRGPAATLAGLYISVHYLISYKDKKTKQSIMIPRRHLCTLRFQIMPQLTRIHYCS